MSVANFCRDVKLTKSQDWNAIYNKLGLGRDTITALQAFRARNTSAANRNAALKTTIPSVDFAHYRSVLRDQQTLGQLEKVLGDFKPVDYDVSKWDGLVDSFQAKAVSLALQLRREQKLISRGRSRRPSRP